MKLIKKILYVFIFMFCTTNIFAQDDFDIKISETEIDEAIEAICGARGINFGEYTGVSFGLDAWYANLNAAHIEILPNNVVKFYLDDLYFVSEIDANIFDFTVVEHIEGVFTGQFVLQGNQTTGYTLVLSLISIDEIDTNGDITDMFGDEYGQILENNFILNFIPEIPLLLTSLTPDLITEVFNLGTPPISTDDGNLYINYNVIGDRFVKIFNELQLPNSNDVIHAEGDIYHLEGSSYQPYPSGFEFAWDKNSQHTFKAEENGVDYDNNHFKYNVWDDGFTSIVRTEPIDKDYNFYAKLENTHNVNFNMTYEGITGSFGNINISGTNYTFPKSEYIFAAPLNEPVTINSSISNSGKNYSFLNWSDGNESLTRNISPTATTNLTANYKGVGLSNNTNTYANNGQRKIVKTSNGNLHRVYESLGKVWYERSTDDGENWTIMNNGQPISSGEAKLPSIDYSDDTDIIMIVYQEKYGNGYKIILKNYNHGSLLSTETIITANWPYSYSSDANPVVAFNYYSASSIFVVWESKYSSSGVLKSWYGSINGSNHIYMEGQDVENVANTNVNSVNPTIVGDDNAANKAHLAWQQNGGWASTSIKYAQMYWNDNIGEITYSNYSEPSNNGGYSTNKYPSISCFDGTPTVAWVCYDEIIYFSQVGVRSKGNGSNWGTTEFLTDYDYHDEINVSINILTDDYDDNEYMVGYVAEGDKVVYYLPEDGEGYLSPYNYDDYVQVCNGEAAFDDAVLSTFNTGSAPYVFHTSTIYSNLSKTNGKSKAIKGRELIITKGSSKLKVRLETPIVDNMPINFADIDDKVTIKNKEKTLSLFRTEEFKLTNDSEFLFNLRCATANKNKEEKTISSNIKLNVVLLDARTNERLGLLKEVSSKSVTEKDKKGLQYKVNTKGIGNRTVKLLVVLDPKSVDKITIVKTSSLNIDVLKKENQIEVALDKDLMVTDYALLQNYPNPFNPSTTIKYQIPNDGMVSLKIYDITGQEVKTLVNKAQAMGRYEVNFDASNLSSGVYLYRLQSTSASSATSFTKTMKMILLK